MRAASLVSLFLMSLAFLTYCAITVRLVWVERGRLRAMRTQAARAGAALCRVSVIVAARNEEASLPRLFSSLMAQDDHDFELVVVIDRSTDGSLELARNFAATAPFIVTVVENQADQPPGYSPKVAPLTAGIGVAAGTLYLFTDADCRVPPAWVSGCKLAFAAEPGLGLYFGLVTVASRPSWINGYQHFDHLYRLTYAAMTVALGFPTGGFGNNLAVRASCYHQTGGFAVMPPSITEDAVLIATVGSSKEWRVGTLTSPAFAVQTEPQKAARSHFRQTCRWTVGAVRSPFISTRLAYNALMVALTLCFIALAGTVVLPTLLPVFFPGLGFLYLSAVVAGLVFYRDGRYWLWLLPGIPLFLLYYQISFLAAIFRPRNEW